MAEKLIPLFRDNFPDIYPDIAFLTHEENKPERYYATYSMGLFFDDKDCLHQPCDFRFVGLHRTAGYILGVDPVEVLLRLTIGRIPAPRRPAAGLPKPPAVARISGARFGRAGFKPAPTGRAAICGANPHIAARDRLRRSCSLMRATNPDAPMSEAKAG